MHAVCVRRNIKQCDCMKQSQELVAESVRCCLFLNVFVTVTVTEQAICHGALNDLIMSCDSSDLFG